MIEKESNNPLEENETKIVDFFAYKRNVEWLVNKYRENWCFENNEEIKDFVYNEEQENSEWIIMEVNTNNIWGPGMIEVVDAADIAYMKNYPSNKYSKLLQRINTLNIYANDEKYFEKYLLSELENKSAERILLLFNKEEDDIKEEYLWLDTRIIQCIPLKKLRKIINEWKEDISKTLLMTYGFAEDNNPEKNHEKFKEIFLERYINQSNSIFASKYRPVFLWWEDLTGSYFSEESLTKKYWSNICDNEEKKKELEQSYIVKQPFIDQWKWILFPWEWSLADGNTIIIKKNKNKVLANYVLQRFHELPRKISIEDWWKLIPKSVDIRAYTIIDPTTGRMSIQIFWREGVVWKVGNISSNWKFTKIYVVKDDVYYNIQKELYNTVFQMWTSQNNTIEKYFDEYSKNNIKVLPEARISPIPFILSESWFERIRNMVYKLVNNMVNDVFIYRNNQGLSLGNLVLGVDISINPLPKEKEEI